jgi:RNA recognition motif-containing protein
MKIIVLNLHRSTKIEQLEKLFKKYGTVESCNLVMDTEKDTSKGFGFVEMPMQGDAKAAMKSLNGKDIAGSKIRVKKAETK